MAFIEIVKGRKYVGRLKGSTTLLQFCIVGISKTKKYIQYRGTSNAGETFFRWEDIDNITILDEIDECEEMDD